jgi:BetR domain
MSVIQQSLFQHIRTILPPNLSLADVVADVLDISMDSAYRRIRGEKAVDIEELTKLCRHFRISLDQVLQLDSDSMVLTGKFIEPQNFDIMHWLESQLQQMQYIASFKEKEIINFCKDIPVWYHYMFPQLAAFKFFAWMKTLMQYPAYQGKKFSFRNVDPSFPEKARQIASVCCQVPTAEIMNVENIHVTLRQIEYYKDTGLFEHPEDIDILYNELNDLTLHMEDICAHGVKFMPGLKPISSAAYCKVYVNDVTVGDNSILCRFDGKEMCINMFTIMNFLTTYNEKYCTYHKAFLHNIVKKSTLISEAGERERTIFFNQMRQKIEASRATAPQPLFKPV